MHTDDEEDRDDDRDDASSANPPRDPTENEKSEPTAGDDDGPEGRNPTLPEQYSQPPQE